METYEIKEAGPAPLVGALCDTFNLTEIINVNTAWDEKQCKLSPGLLTKALVINILCGRTPLSHVEKFYIEQDTELLFGPGITSADMNDDVLGRALDKIHVAGPRKIFSALTLSAINTDSLDLSFLHSDTTSRFVYGNYSGEGTLDIVRGHSKDYRPDLNQFLCGLATSKDGVPVLGNIANGNKDDKTWNKEMMGQIQEFFAPEKLQQLIYVADSAAVNEECMQKARSNKIKIISRLPNTFSLAANLIEMAWQQDQWISIENTDKKRAKYKWWETSAQLYNEDYRFIVVHSSHLDKRKLKALERRVHKEREQLEHATAKLEKKEFVCAADALKELDRFKEANRSRFFSIVGNVTKRTVRKKRQKRGRPAANEVQEYQDIYSVQTEVGKLNQEAFDQEQQRLSCFILVNNLPGSYSGADILREYKEQSVVENRFKFIKSPTFVGPIYLQNKNRLEALCYVILAALLMYSLLERRVRLALKTEDKPLILVGKVPSFSPTGRRILELLKPIKLLIIAEGGQTRRILPGRYAELGRVMKLAGFDLSIYTKQ